MRKIKWFAIVILLVGCKEVGSITSTSCWPVKTLRVPCSELPNSEEVSEIITQHSDIVEKIEDINNIHIRVVQTDVKGCSGKSVIIIEHASVEECNEIKKVLNSNDFFGVPYGLLNL